MDQLVRPDGVGFSEVIGG